MNQAFLYIVCLFASTLLAARGSTDLTGIRAVGNKLVNYRNEPVQIRVSNFDNAMYIPIGEYFLGL